MNAFLIALVLQSLLLLPPRTAVENPAAVSQVPQKLKKDYDKIWTRFLTGKEDAKLVKDLDKLLKKEKTFDPAWVMEGYVELYRGDDTAARQKFTQALTLNAKNRIALYYLAELAYAHSEYARATTLYAQLLSLDATHSDILEPKRQRALLLAIDNLLRSAARAEEENRLAESEQYYRQALNIVPKDPTLHGRLADLLAKENKTEEAAAERRAAEELTPRRAARARAADDGKSDSLEDLGRWGNNIEVFHQIRNAEAVTREQFAVLIIRYFPQVTEFRQNPQILTDTQNSPARSEIQTLVGIGLIDPMPNHTFEPTAPITRGDLATALARLSRLLSVSPASVRPIAAPDLAPTNAQYAEVQLVLGSGLMTLEDSGRFNVGGLVSGREAVRSADQLLRTFQQVQR
jgi:tetratricopeptide (TPR) repeat protein